MQEALPQDLPAFWGKCGVDAPQSCSAQGSHAAVMDESPSLINLLLQPLVGLAGSLYLART